MRRRGSRLRKADSLVEITNSWSMDENSGTTLVDSIGGIDLSYPVDLSASSVPGVVGNAIDFAIAGNNAQTVVNPSLSWIKNIEGLNKAIPFTIMLWVTDNRNVHFNPILSYGSGGFYHMYIRITNNYLQFILMYNAGGVNVESYFGNFTIPIGVKTHLTVVFDPYKQKNIENVNFYQNAILKSSQSFTNNIPSDGSLRLESHYFTAGGYGFTGSRTTEFIGVQDEIKIAMGSVMSDSQILNIYNAEKP